MVCEKFPPANRVRKRAEYDWVFKKGLRVGKGIFLLRIHLKKSGEPRIGLIVSRKIGNAVVRNRVKRVAREIFRRNKCKLSPIDIVFIAHREIKERSYFDIEQAFLSSLKAKELFLNGKGRC